MAVHRRIPGAAAKHPNLDATVFVALIGSLAMVSYTVAGAIF
jgi:hypothetical protein